MNKLLIVIIILICITGFSSCSPQEVEEFAIYLLDEDISAIAFSEMDIQEASLEANPLISGNDIVSYDLNSHTIILTPEAYSRLQQVYPIPVKVSGIPFVVCVGTQRIYSGALWTPLSSISFDGVVIMQPFEVDVTTIQLALGYPGPEAFTGLDPRADFRIVRALEQTNKMNPIPENSTGK